eukprot:354212-Chlamydomonas_euryale.AAC.24
MKLWSCILQGRHAAHWRRRTSTWAQVHGRMGAGAWAHGRRRTAVHELISAGAWAHGRRCIGTWARVHELPSQLTAVLSQVLAADERHAYACLIRQLHLLGAWLRASYARARRVHSCATRPPAGLVLTPVNGTR